MSKTALKIDTITEQPTAAQRQTAGSRPLNDVERSGDDGTTACAFFCSSLREKKRKKKPRRVTTLEILSFRSCFLHLPGSDPQPRRLGPLLPIRPTAHLAASSSLTPRRGPRCSTDALQPHCRFASWPERDLNIQPTSLNLSSTSRC